LKALLREPLIHFALIGALLFALQGWLGASESAPDEIVVRGHIVDALARDFTQNFERPPTRQELDNLIGEYVREEVYYREATATGLDREDAIVRRRLRQKMEFIAENPAAERAPTQAELEQFFERQKADYATEQGTPALAEVREAVLRDWISESRRRAVEDAYGKLRAKYTVRVESSGAPGP
jgi:hypothetical protein